MEIFLKTFDSYKGSGGKKIRIALNYRALSFEDAEDFIWVWIETHKEYNAICNFF
ncbi:Uncharacterized protein dnm_097930 [Desulfonema magnum]|uniref:Uncharacterized protein n=1 Tax=Desulfonema magnum TaxID=45655 RepID=A0A975GU18_9BACT|nr:Uncharacterized protein dnm_097930 [Desulfonema magnum]